MIKVGLVGEDPNDTSSIKNLLKGRYHGKVNFCQLLRNIRGFQLDNPKVNRSLVVEFEDSKCDVVLFIRDLDAFESERIKVSKKITWFDNLNCLIDKKGVFLLNIWELESLILGDIDTFNKLFKTDYKFKGNPMLQKEPKELLKKISSKSARQFRESSCPSIFEKLDIRKIEERCKCFSDFLVKFEEKLKA